METSLYFWLLNMLATQRSKIPVLDTYYVKANKPIALYYQTKTQQFSLVPENAELIDVLSKIYREAVLQQKLGLTKDLACCLFFNTRRHRLTLQGLEMILTTEALPSDLSLIQLPKPNAMDGQLTYQLKLKRSSNGLVPSMCLLNKAFAVSAEAQQTATRIATQIVSLIEDEKKEAVSYLEIEFTADSDGNMWLSNFNRLEFDTVLLTQSTIRLRKRPSTDSLRTKHKTRNAQTSSFRWLLKTQQQRIKSIASSLLRTQKTPSTRVANSEHSVKENEAKKLKKSQRRSCQKAQCRAKQDPCLTRRPFN